ncbi:high affinity nitrate transporter 2.5-like [Euphorbia lathyris]|uniref:high affinity nitrate transporter 2.5-like n=1 Tax=Euphorbia lathyris TaxID=212925 RepID=UPI0033131B62
MGTACDLFRPRLASASLILLTAPAVYFTSIVSSPISFLLVRFFTGFSLATFVSTQFWMSSMLSAPVVATANGVAAGWGNLDGGATQLIMPLVFSLIRDIGAAKFTAWRISFFIPALFQTLSAFAVLMFGKDLPDGNFARLEKSGDKHKDKFSNIFYHGLKNYRGWILALSYGYCFGVELTIDNIIAEYFYDRFNLKLHTAGIIAASFGLANIIFQPGGGIISDMVGKKYGMRAACGLTFGVVPFVLRRSLGLISGMTGEGGNVGAVHTQLIFFKGSKYSKETWITLMGIMIICCTIPICFIHFPQWGGMFWGPRKVVTEEDYYMSEWSSKEKEQGLHLSSLKFADNSIRERGNKRVVSEVDVHHHTSSVTV